MQNFSALFLLLCASGLSGQVADQGVTASASRTVTLVADEAVFEVVVTAGSGTSLERVLAVLQPAGIREEHMVGLSSQASGYVAALAGQPSVTPATNLTWQFVATQPAARLRETLNLLEEIPLRRPEGVLIVSYNAYLSASARVVEQARQAALADLLTEARRRAESLARAGGFTVGPIQFLSDSSSTASNRITLIGGLFLAGDNGGIRVTFSLSVRYGKGT